MVLLEAVSLWTARFVRVRSSRSRSPHTPYRQEPFWELLLLYVFDTTWEAILKADLNEIYGFHNRTFSERQENYNTMNTYLEKITLLQTISFQKMSIDDKENTTTEVIEEEQLHYYNKGDTTTTSPNVIPLSRGLRRSGCRQPYPRKYHYSQRGRFQKTHKKILRKPFLYFENF